MSSNLTTAQDVINELGGYGEVAALVGLKYNAVFEWKRANRIPSRLYLLMNGELEKRGKSASPAIWGMGS